MSGMTLFISLNDVRDSIIEESLMLFDTPADILGSKEQNGFRRFLNSGWGVAMICVIVSLAVLIAIVQAGRNAPVTPPVPGTVETDGVTAPESEPEDPLETRQETESEADTEAVTEAVTAVIVDTWNGKIASAFGGGKGTESDPYLIQSCAQLAYLAKKVNAGSNYAGKYFRLEADLDLKNRLWTPIGTYEKYFSGHFDGNGHSVSGLVVAEALTNQNYACAGLFGYIANGSLRGVWLKSPELDIDLAYKTAYVYIGALCGAYRCDNGDVDVSFEGCRVTDAVVVARRGDLVSVGGMIGYVVAYDGDDITLRRLESQVSRLKISDSGTVRAGGLAGYLNCQKSGRIEMENFCGYATISPTRSGQQYMGTIGAIGAPIGRITLRSGHGSVKVDGELISSSEYKNSGHAMIGVVYDGATAKRYYFYDLFGELVAQNMTKTNLYYCDAAVESGIDHSSAYPKKGVLDEDVWDLSNRKKPTIKFP